MKIVTIVAAVATGAVVWFAFCTPPSAASDFRNFVAELFKPEDPAGVRLRSPLSTMPAGIMSQRFRDAHDHGF